MVLWGIVAHKDEPMNPDLQFSDDIGPVLDLYRSIGDPLLSTRRNGTSWWPPTTADTTVVGDAESEQTP